MKVKEFELREYTEEEYQANLRKELTEGCLLKAIHKRCDEINYLSSNLGYITHRTIQEQMVEIQDLIKAYMDMQKGTDVIDLIDRHLWNYSHEVWEDFKPILEQLKEQKNEMQTQK